MEPLWVFGSVGFCVACGRKQLSLVENIWKNKYSLIILIMIVVFFIPIESWVLYCHTDWETTFILEKDSSHFPLCAGFAVMLHLSVAIFAYWLSIHVLTRYGSATVVRLSFLGFGLFFSSQGMFYDTLMYSGSFEEFHNGEEKSFLSFFLTGRFRDAYVLFFICFGSPFYCIILTLNQASTQIEKVNFIKILWNEIALQGSCFCAIYAIICSVGVLSDRYTLLRLPVVAIMYFIPHATLLLPFYFFLEKDDTKSK